MDTPVTIQLTRSERELILNVLHLSPEVQHKVANTRIASNRYSVELTQQELEGLLSGLGSEINATRDRTMAKAYEELRDRLEGLGGGAAS